MKASTDDVLSKVLSKERRFSAVEQKRRYSTAIEPRRRFSTAVETRNRLSSIVETNSRDMLNINSNEDTGLYQRTVIVNRNMDSAGNHYSASIDPQCRFSGTAYPRRKVSFALEQPSLSDLSKIDSNEACVFDHRRTISSETQLPSSEFIYSNQVNPQRRYSIATDSKRRFSTFEARRRFSTNIEPRRRFSTNIEPRRRFSTITTTAEVTDEQELLIELKSRKRSRDKKNYFKYFFEEKAKEETPKLSAKEAFRACIYDTVKNVFSLSCKEDGDININIDNVFPLMKALDLDTKDEAILDMVHEACIESFGNIEINEFDSTVMQQRRRVAGEEFDQDIRSAFSMIDVDADGIISVQDLYQLMMGIGEMLTDDGLSELLEAADNDGDGQVNYKDFKFFLTGELEEDQPEAEGENIEEELEAEIKESDDIEAKDDDEKTDELKPEESKEEMKEEKEDVLTQEEIEARETKERMKKKSILWAFASQKTPEKPEEKSAEKAEKPIEKQIGKDSKEPDNKSDSDSENPMAADDTKHVTAVTVNYLNSEAHLKDDNSGKHEDAHVNDDQPKNASSRRQSFSAKTSVDSGIDAVDDDEIQKGLNEKPESVVDEGFFSRTQSARSRLSHDKSRVSSAKSNFPSRPSTAKSIFEQSIEESVADDDTSRPESRWSARRSSRSTAIGIGDTKELTEDEQTDLDENEFQSPMTSRQIEFQKYGKQQQIYCEAGVNREYKDENESDVDTLDLESVIQFDPNEISPRINLTKLKQLKQRKAVPTFQRTRSATRLRTFKKIENAILIRQNTDPRLNIEYIKAANQRTFRETNDKMAEQPKPNSNGLFCTHISIDLNVEETEPPRTPSSRKPFRVLSQQQSPKVSATQTTLRKLLQRPQTAMTFREAEKKNIVHVYSKNNDYKANSNKFDGSMKIVDLSNMVSMDTDKFEKPGLNNHHHGYKSVLPLGRVLSGYKNKMNHGSGIVLNSISRKLERIQYLTRIQGDKQSYPQYSKDYSSLQSRPELSQRQSIINLQLPEGLSKKSCRNQKCPSKFPSRPLIGT